MISQRSPRELGGDDGVEGRVTALTRQRRDPERMNIFLDGAFAFGLGVEVVLREGLAVGDELDAAAVSRLRSLDESGKATSAALALLARRPRSEREVRHRLRQKGYGDAAIDDAIGRLEGWGYLDDAAFARFWVENRVANKPRGERLMAQELWQKGVARPVVQEAIAAAEIDETEAALSVAGAKLRSYRDLDPMVARRRLAAYLARRGFGYDVVRPVLDRVLGDGDEDADTAKTDPSDS